MQKVTTSKDVRRWFKVYGFRTAAAILLLVFCCVLSSCGGSASAGAGPKAVAKDFRAEAEEAITGLDPAMGDWQGTWQLSDGSDTGPLVAQVIAKGKGEYQAKFFEVFDTRAEPIGILVGQIDKLAGLAYHSEINFDVQAKVEDGKLTGTFKGRDADVDGAFSLTRVFRVSPTMGAEPPPKGAVVLFSGKEKDLKKWKRHGAKEDEDDTVKWEIVDGAMRVTKGGGNIITRKEFENVSVHLEFRTPFMPEARGQGRGNSGVYLQGKYEVQVLDSYALEGKSNECGGIYGVKAPKVNMCAPPGQWQTYDITFRAATATSPATLTVLHNNVSIHHQTPVGGTTTAGVKGKKATDPGGLYLQDHGNPVEYRNIWLIEQ
ncbi:MAG: 3-keto-disaccharide hydrolase [Planctomycetota bacterium]|jgi:hypothetical protein